MRVVLAGLLETATFHGICSTAGMVGRGAKKPISRGETPSRDHREGSEVAGESSRLLE